MIIPGHDIWKLRGPDEPHQIGTEAGQTCGRYPEPCEDMPRGYRPRPCGGLMYLDSTYGDVVCESCGSLA